MRGRIGLVPPTYDPIYYDANISCSYLILGTIQV